MKKYLVMTLIWLSIMVSLSWAQYFGRNKVQYEDFDFEVLNTENFNIYYYEQEKQAILDASFMLERWLSRLDKVFGYKLQETQPVILYSNHADFQQTNVISGTVSQGVGGVTEGMMRRIVIPLTGVSAENDHVLGHELAHAYHYDLMKRRGAGRQNQRMPLWVIEGMSEYLTIGHEAPLTAMWMRDAVLNEDVPTLKQAGNDPEYFPYRFGHAIWAYLAGRYGDEIVAQLFANAITNGWDNSVENILGFKRDSLSSRWQEAIRQKFAPQLEGRTKPAEVGRAVVTGEDQTNLSPAVSPDGKYMALISNKDLFTLDLFMIDTETGEVIKKLVSSNTDEHFDALRFMNASGSWSPDAEKFAFVVFKNGDNAVAILDVESGKVQTIKIAEMDAIKYLAWSPNGEAIAISGTSGGIGNLYLLDISSEQVVQLTDDKHAEIQPAWSPDGQTLAVATDRGPDTNFRLHTFSKMKIGLFDVESREWRILSIGDKVKHINPHFSPDGNNLYFIADADGFSDLYRYEFATDSFFRLTKIATGISGLTELSPALTVAKQSGQIFFTIFDHRNYHIYELPEADFQGEPVYYDEREYLANVALPPYSQQALVDQYLDDPTIGEIRESQWTQNDYNADLQLMYVSQTSIGVAVDRFGTGVGGGVHMLFGDVLGNHMLQVAAQVNGGYKDIGGQATYLNQDNRIGWGGVLGHIPYRTGRVFTSFDTTTVNGDTTLVRNVNLVRQRIFVDQALAIAEYPLSQNRRFEFSGGYRRISYDYELEQTTTTLGGFFLDTETRDLDSPDALNFFQGSVAYVGDYSFMGFTSPIDGKRYRFEVEPTLGDFRYASVLADYRKYVNVRPWTFAFRIMHYGRYGQDSQNPLLGPLYLGYETYVRGYDLGTFNTSKECTNFSDPRRCPEYERLFGSRMGVFNAEIRLPIFGNEQYGVLNFPFLPTDLVAFFDGGVTWTKDDTPEWTFTESSSERIPVFSAGLAARANLLGFLVGQVYYAYPFQRPEKGPHFGFVFAPGW
jgi:hypothetical protein